MVTPCSAGSPAASSRARRSRPSATALTTSLPPLTQSPPLQTLGLPVAPVAGSATTQPRASSATPGNCARQRAELRLADGERRRGRTARSCSVPATGLAVLRRAPRGAPTSLPPASRTNATGTRFATRRTPSFARRLHLVRVAAHRRSRRGGRPSSRPRRRAARTRARRRSPCCRRRRRRTRPSRGPRAGPRASSARSTPSRRRRPGPSSPGMPSRVSAPEAQAEEDRVVLARASCVAVHVLRRPRRPCGSRRRARCTHSTSCERVVGVQLVRRDPGRVEPPGERSLLEDTAWCPSSARYAAHASDAGPAPTQRDALRLRPARLGSKSGRSASAVAVSVAKRCRRPIAIGVAVPRRCRRTRPRRAPRPGTPARTSTPRMFCSRIVRAAAAHVAASRSS